jgi:hypothetical protein
MLNPVMVEMLYREKVNDLERERERYRLMKLAKTNKTVRDTNHLVRFAQRLAAAVRKGLPSGNRTFEQPQVRAVPNPCSD